MDLAYTLTHLATQLPAALVLVAGGALLAARRPHLPRVAVALALAGCAVLLAELLVGFAWTMAIQSLLESNSTTTIGVTGLAFGVVQALLYATGLGLLVGSVLASRRSD